MIYRVRVGGTDVSSRLSPYLISLRVSLSDEPDADTASIVLDDSGGRLALPPERAPVEIDMGTDESGVAHIFSGVVDVPRGEGARGSGRELHVEAKSVDPQGKSKAPKERHFDDTTVGEAMKKAGRDAGITMKVHPDLASLPLAYLALDGTSFEHFGAELAADLGATFKIMGTTGLLVPRNAGLSATGKALVTVRAEAGRNLERWSLTPVRGKPRWKKVRVRTWDAKAAKYVYRDKEVEADSESEFLSARPAADKDAAKSRADGAAAEGEHDKGEGSVTIIGDVTAQPGAPVIVGGTRPGLDGTYQAGPVQQEMGRSAGFLTTIDLKRPQASADTRKSS